MKKLAVLLPTYNAAPYIRESIDSVLNQSFGNFDLYIYDDFSTDNTEEIISQYKDQRIFYRKNIANLGIAKSLNKGLDELLPHYEFIARMDADDWSYPNRFEKQLEFLDKNKEIILCGTQGYWLQDMRQNPVSGWEYPTNHEYINCCLLFTASFGHSSVIFRSDNFQKNNLRYNETINTCEDWDLWTRVVKTGQVANLPDFFMKYRILENSNHRSPLNLKKHFEERSTIISGFWTYSHITLSSEQVYEYYYQISQLSKSDFITKIKLLVDVFNSFYVYNANSLVTADRKKLSYLLSRRILDYWKRSKVSRIDPQIWLFLIKAVKFENKFKLLKSIIK
ncbi:glycosyltransferase family 2 protein [Flavobacterium xinjiangense]|uniref:Glycosyl transferase family 2 n=1 Tax=Flavobacterium xinjiangense TaxID=178356 RepID=A0A1M7MWD0_9FLAO|nr:glycosyltransferase family A protein [Flavobacterium xinjiangense]SHM95369.1 Glycosyl transferase family 2 [Flavobacterium xinjiangense]